MSLLPRVLVVLAVALLAAGCPSSHEPDDPRPPCPEGPDFEWGNACTEQADCEDSHCGRLGGVCVDYAWICGECDLCFYRQTSHVENSYMSCNMETGLCED